VLRHLHLSGGIVKIARNIGGPPTDRRGRAPRCIALQSAGRRVIGAPGATRIGPTSPWDSVPHALSGTAGRLTPISCR
jgi:hypothetical protein